MKINYPNDFKSSSENVKPSDDSINKNIENAIESLKKSEETHYIMWTGTAMLLVMKLHEEDGGGFEIIVTHNYDRAYVDNEIFNSFVN